MTSADIREKAANEDIVKTIYCKKHAQNIIHALLPDVFYHEKTCIFCALESTPNVEIQNKYKEKIDYVMRALAYEISFVGDVMMRTDCGEARADIKDILDGLQNIMRELSDD